MMLAPQAFMIVTGNSFFSEYMLHCHADACNAMLAPASYCEPDFTYFFATSDI